ncbi:MAG: hypothetical protein GW815_03305 [Candidatus Moranbacteria bacterium]|nr:hypothetical protein [Candidatus Moranbacteria bacterium]OIQ03243.1 MAG: hypothetical protein AUK58_01940 [Candidatus Moranbacteria bacterium CG2_30_41_165]PIP25872.1 MAG: hypothetical protein COX32_01045 [Candidatus Moranbacteria bacterium CG23_combo_of_CG06-09_8_20_14_all_41_28]PIW93983.1 MAG: hypothetical protein COZ86_03395 [Candidatus Moranbacteria bacterium CG_4_8_14_3_um_filter_41_13]PJC00305.1 MAG: hypothetical protein CO075_01280 [Candidatus Moranbacteria bacterium CG_4_9_14_0_8_um_
MNKTTLGLGALALLVGVAGISTVASAYRGDSTVKGPNYTEERHEAMEKAFESGDYNAWKSLMGERGNMTRVINQDNFAKFAEAHELSEEGKTAEAQKIREELGLGLHNGSGQGRGQHAGAGRGMNR